MKRLKKRPYQLPVRVDEGLRTDLLRVAHSDERKLAPMVTILLREALEARGQLRDGKREVEE